MNFTVLLWDALVYNWHTSTRLRPAGSGTVAPDVHGAIDGAKRVESRLAGVDDGNGFVMSSACWGSPGVTISVGDRGKLTPSGLGRPAVRAERRARWRMSSSTAKLSLRTRVGANEGGKNEDGRFSSSVG